MHVLRRWQCVSVEDGGGGVGVSPSDAGLSRFRVLVVFCFVFIWHITLGVLHVICLHACGDLVSHH